MKNKGIFAWYSSLMEIVSVEERVSKSTKKPYMIVKAKMVFSGNIRFLANKKQSRKAYTMMCFSESLFALFEVGNVHGFEGELSFDWGNTWLKITKLYDDEGNRLLKPTEIKDIVKFDEKLLKSIGENFEEYFQRRTGEKQRPETEIDEIMNEDGQKYEREHHFLPY